MSKSRIDSSSTTFLSSKEKSRTFFSFFGLWGTILFSFLSSSADARWCPSPPSATNPASNTAAFCRSATNAGGAVDSCCCNDGSWQQLGFASAAECRCQYASWQTPAITATHYCSGTAPTTCAHMGLRDAPANLCATNPEQCPGYSLGATPVPCACPPSGAVPNPEWDGEGCGRPGAVPGPPTSFDPASAWAEHNPLGATLPSDLPNRTVNGVLTPFPAGTNYTHLANPMAAACATGWGENLRGSRKLDCVEAIAPAVPNNGSAIDFRDRFFQFYGIDLGAPAVQPVVAGVTNPNQLFIVGENNRPINGFYRDNGQRCRYNGNATYTVAQQMTIFREALINGIAPDTVRAPQVVPWSVPPRVEERCCNLLVFALERECPRPPDTRAGITVRGVDAGNVRCTAAARMRVIYALFDLCDARAVERGKFRTITNFPVGNNVEGVVSYRVNMNQNDPDPLNPYWISTRNLFNAFYVRSPLPPAPLPPNRRCPDSPAVRSVPWTNDVCDLQPN